MEQYQPLVYIILLNYRGYQDTAACLNSLGQLKYSNYKIVVVDNASGDGSYERLKREFLDCIMILSKENAGFAAGNNIGIRYALENGADYVMLLNNDTVVTPEFLDLMVQYADEQIVTTPSIYYFDQPQKIWYANAAINYRKCIAENGSDAYSGYVTYASGCCFLIHRSLIEKIGLLAEEYFMYYEDMDYSIRIVKGGAAIFYVKEAVIYHKVGGSAGHNSKVHLYYDNRNRFYIMEKHHFGKGAWVYSYVTRMIRYVQGMISNSNEKITLRAYRDYRNHVMGKSYFD